MRPRESRHLGGSIVLVANPGADLYGSDRMALESVAALRAEGCRVVVVVPEDGPLCDQLRAGGAEVKICPTPILRKSFKSPVGVIRLVGEVLRRTAPMISLIRRVDPDVIYVNTITTPLWLFGAWLLRRPSVCHVHEGEASAPPFVLRALYLPLLLADRLIVNSKFSMRVLLGAVPRLARKTVVVYNAVVGPMDAVPARPILLGPVRLLYVGRLSPRKGPDVAIDAVGLLRERGVDARLDLVGAVFRGYEWFKEELDARVAEGGLETLVTFHGFRTDVWPYIAATDIVLVPSTIDEPFGNTAVEAILGARPLVVSNIAGLTEASAGMSAVVRVRAGDAAAVADAIDAILHDWQPFCRRALDDAALAKDRHSCEGYAHRIVAAVTSAMAS